MYFIGDVHGKWEEYFELIQTLPESIQVGDFGFGFRSQPKSWNMNHRFIRGNHDSPKACKEHSNYLGDYGVYKDIFFVSGAYSIDYMYRTIGISWWEDEEISQKEFDKILNLYSFIKPEIVVAHDAPSFVKAYMTDAIDKRAFINRTSNLLMPEMIAIHKPKLWVFGHYHCSFKKEIDKTTFICLDELEIFG